MKTTTAVEVAIAEGVTFVQIIMGSCQMDNIVTQTQIVNLATAKEAAPTAGHAPQEHVGEDEKIMKNVIIGKTRAVRVEGAEDAMFAPDMMASFQMGMVMVARLIHIVYLIGAKGVAPTMDLVMQVIVRLIQELVCVRLLQLHQKLILQFRRLLNHLLKDIHVILTVKLTNGREMLTQKKLSCHIFHLSAIPETMILGYTLFPDVDLTS